MDQRRQPRPLLTRSTSLSSLRLKRLFSGVRPPPPTAITHLGAEFVVDLQQLRVSEAVHTPLLLSATTWIFTCRFCANARMEVDHPVVLHRFAHCVTCPHAHTPHVLRVLTLILSGVCGHARCGVAFCAEGDSACHAGVVALPHPPNPRARVPMPPWHQTQRVPPRCEAKGSNIAPSRADSEIVTQGKPPPSSDALA